MEKYLSRSELQIPATTTEVSGRNDALHALRTVHSLLIRDWVDARVKLYKAGGDDAAAQSEMARLKSSISLIEYKIFNESVAYYEADHSRQAEYERLVSAGLITPGVPAHSHDHHH